MSTNVNTGNAIGAALNRKLPIKRGHGRAPRYTSRFIASRASLGGDCYFILYTISVKETIQFWKHFQILEEGETKIHRIERTILLRGSIAGRHERRRHSRVPSPKPVDVVGSDLSVTLVFSFRRRTCGWWVAIRRIEQGHGRRAEAINNLVAAGRQRPGVGHDFEKCEAGHDV